MYNNVQSNFLPYSLWDTTAANASALVKTVDYKMVCGDHDGQLSNNQLFANYLLSLGINPKLQILPNVGHAGSMYIHDPTGLAFLNQHFLKSQQMPIHLVQAQQMALVARAVPEPSAWVLLASASAVLVGRRRRAAESALEVASRQTC
jgi:hypothetical protein